VRLLRRNRDRDPLAPLRSSAAEHFPAAGGRHPGTKPMCALSARPARLKRSLHFVTPAAGHSGARCALRTLSNFRSSSSCGFRGASGAAYLCVARSVNERAHQKNAVSRHTAPQRSAFRTPTPLLASR
jgi:hypothetical protein